jgi:Lrp/AsnC family leucine-responsive transcriptional regulator
MIDEIDKKILYHLSADSRMSIERLSELVSLSPTPVRRRVRRLEETGILKRYTIDVDMEKCGFGQLMYVYIKLQSRDRETISKFEARVRTLPEVTVCNLVTGTFDYILEVRSKGMADYNDFLHNVLAELPGAFGIETSVVISPVKRETALP